jgi:hypothetical protein
LGAEASPTRRGANREAGPYRQGQPLLARRARPVRDGRLLDRHPPRRAVPAQRPPSQAERHRRGLPGHLRDRLLISDRGARFTDPGPCYYTPANPQRRTRSKIREIERLNPGMKVTLTPIDPAATAA